MFVWSENGYRFKKPAGLEIGVKNDFFGLKLGQYLENWMAHPHQEFLGVPPLPPPGHFNIWGGAFFAGGGGGGLKIGYIFCLQVDELITAVRGGLISGGLRYKIK